MEENAKVQQIRSEFHMKSSPMMAQLNKPLEGFLPFGGLSFFCMETIETIRNTKRLDK